MKIGTFSIKTSHVRLVSTRFYHPFYQSKEEKKTRKISKFETIKTFLGSKIENGIQSAISTLTLSLLSLLTLRITTE